MTAKTYSNPSNARRAAKAAAAKLAKVEATAEVAKVKAARKGVAKMPRTPVAAVEVKVSARLRLGVAE
jgi:hypothetical protein